jgi:hypothetical protein
MKPSSEKPNEASGSPAQSFLTAAPRDEIPASAAKRSVTTATARSLELEKNVDGEEITP